MIKKRTQRLERNEQIKRMGTGGAEEQDLE